MTPPPIPAATGQLRLARRAVLGNIGAMFIGTWAAWSAPGNPNQRRVEATMKLPEKRSIDVAGLRMAFQEVGTGRPIVLLHGNPTSSYLWRNVVPGLAALGRCLAPDLPGMGDSGKPSPGPESHWLAQNQRAVDGWFDALGLDRDIVLVVHDWGSVLGFDWARRHARTVRGIVHMEAIVASLRSDSMSPEHRQVLATLRSAEGERAVLLDNRFIEFNLPRGIIRKLSDAEMAEYRRPFLKPGEDRRPTLSWPRQLPIDGDPAEVNAILGRNDFWLRASPTPKLYIRAEPGTHSPEMTTICRGWSNQKEVAAKGLHYPQEDSPAEVAEAIAAWLNELD